MTRPVGAEEYRVALIPGASVASEDEPDYWNAVRAGALKAVREMEPRGVQARLYWMPPTGESPAESQAQKVRLCVSASASGILIAPAGAGPEALALLGEPVERAAEAEIPVVLIDAPWASARPALPLPVLASVGVDGREPGVQAARRIGELLGGKGAVAILGEWSETARGREQAFREALRMQFPGIRILTGEPAPNASREWIGLAASHLVRRLAEGEAQAVFTPSTATTLALLQAMRDVSLAPGKVVHVACDADASVLNALRARALQGVVVKNGFEIGYQGMKTLLVQIAGLGRAEPNVTVPSLLLTPETLDLPQTQAVLHPPLPAPANERE